MSNIAIRVENLGKKYKLGGKKSGSFRESVSNLFTRQPSDEGTNSTTEFWALKDINFEVKRGEAIGIIGRNGAGKSTLLKILSRITEPTKGRFEVFGRVSSLLEVGTGFHPELTGRENVYLNGTILGMKRREVKAKFDEIVAFSGVEKFIDTPVKHYSSGMQVRLAFAVAAHLEPEILIIDEVLAVGDAEFQKKCLGKMEDVTGQGRTVLFVSHNMQAVKNLCTTGIYLNQGQVFNYGSIETAVEKYLKPNSSAVVDFNELPIDPDFKFLTVHTCQNSLQTNVILNDQLLELLVEYELKKEIKGLRLRIDVLDSEEYLLFRSHIDDNQNDFHSKITDKNKYLSVIKFPSNLFVAGEYKIKLQASIYGIRPIEPKEGIIIPISVEETGKILRKKYPYSERGKLTIALQWLTSKIENEVLR